MDSSLKALPDVPFTIWNEPETTAATWLATDAKIPEAGTAPSED
jgi:hypothetical protein